jgi:putative hydrolase of HD superfamily
MLTRLKTTKREGWRRFGIAQGESISDHMYRMSLITLFCPAALASQLDIPRCVKMALVHDMAEALVGDITPVDGVPKDEKNRRESATMDYFVEGLLGRVQGATSGEALKAVWQEYEDGVTLEARFVHDVDKIELLLQMVEYEKEKDGELDLGEFSYVATKVELPEMKLWADEILTEREKFWEGKPHKSLLQGAVAEKKQLEAADEYYRKLEDKA